MDPDDVIRASRTPACAAAAARASRPGMKWSFIPQGGRQAALPGDQRRRVRTGYLQRHSADDGRPRTRSSRARSSPPTRSGRTTRSSTCAARCVPVLRRLQAAVAEAYEAGLPRQGHPRLGLRPRPRRARGRRRLHLRRGDRAAGLAGGPPRPAAAAAAVPRGRRAVRLPDRGQQRRVHRQRARRSCATASTGSGRWAPRSRPGFTLYSLSGHVTTPGQYEAPLGITLRELLEYAGGVRGGPRAEVLDAGRLVDPAVDRTNTSTSRWITRAWRRPARCSAPRRCRSSTRPPAWCARSGGGPSSTPTSPAASARPAARAPTGWSRSTTAGDRAGRRGRPRQAARHLRHHPRQVLLRARRRCASPIISSIKYFRDEYVRAPRPRRLPLRSGGLDRCSRRSGAA